MGIAVTVDSGSGISQEEGASLGVGVVPIPFTIGGEPRLEGVDMTSEEFFSHLSKGETCTTTLPPASLVSEVWDRALKDHDSVLHIPLTSGLSGATEAARLLSHTEPYAGRVFVTDARKVSVPARQTCLDALELASRGMSAAQIADVLETNADNNTIYLQLCDLEHLKRGGRLTPAVASIGGLLKMRPVLSIKNGSKLDLYKLTRNVKRARQAMIDALRSDLVKVWNDPDCHSCYVQVAYTDNPEEAADFALELAEAFPGRTSAEIVTRPLPLAVACHVGSGVLGTAVYKKIPELA